MRAEADLQVEPFGKGNDELDEASVGEDAVTTLGENEVIDFITGIRSS